MAGMLLLSLSYDELQNCRIAELQNFGIAFFGHAQSPVYSVVGFCELPIGGKWCLMPVKPLQRA